MTVTVGSVWKHKRSTKLRCSVIATMKYHGEKFIIYETRPVVNPVPYLAIKSHREFLRIWEHPDPIGDVP